MENKIGITSVSDRNEPFRVVTHRGWWKKPTELLVWPGDRLTMIPVVRRKPLGFWRILWLRICPEFWRRHKRYRAHKRYLAQLCIVDKKVIKHFASNEHLLNEMIRIKGLPPIEWEAVDARKRTTQERRELLRSQFKAAFEEYRRNTPPPAA